MGVWINEGLSRWCTCASFLHLDDKLLLFVVPVVVTEAFTNLEFLSADPERALIGPQIVREVHLLIEFLSIFENDLDWLPFSKTVESGVGHHH